MPGHAQNGHTLARMKRLLYPTASVQTHSSDRIGVAVVSGVVTVEALRLIVHDSQRWGTKGEALANLVVYRDAALGLGLDAMIEAAAGAKAALSDIAPAALVVAPDRLAMFQEYSFAMAQRGALIAAFTSQQEAERWTARQAVVREHWRALRHALRSDS